MTITRKSLADTIDAYDDEIADLQTSKRDTFQAYREQLAALMGKDEVKVEIEATKAAIKRRRAIREKGEEVIEHKDALADEIFDEITAGRTPRATRVENTQEFRFEEDVEARRRRRFTESMEDTIALSAQAVRDGLIAPEAHDETVRLSRALAAKFGNSFVDPDADGVVEHITDSALAASNSNADAPVPSGAAKEVSPDASFATHEAERSTVSSADSQREPASVPLVSDPLSDADAQRSTAGPNSLGSAADKSAGGGISPAPAAPTKLKMNAEFFEEPHPQCQRPQFCGGNSRLGLCDECQAAAARAGGHVHDAEERVLN